MEFLRMRATERYFNERRIGKQASEHAILIPIGPVFRIGKEARIFPDVPLNGAVELAISLGDGEELFGVWQWEKAYSGAIENVKMPVFMPMPGRGSGLRRL